MTRPDFANLTLALFNAVGEISPKGSSGTKRIAVPIPCAVSASRITSTIGTACK
jgi:hypothetical protein